MPSIIDYFNNDFHDFSIDRSLSIKVPTKYSKNEIVSYEEIPIKERLRQNVDTSHRMFTYYIPSNKIAFMVIQALIDNLPKNTELANEIILDSGFASDIKIGDKKYLYSKRLYFYIENELTSFQIANLAKIAEGLGIEIVIRGPQYMRERQQYETPAAFISHDSRDKDLIVRVIASGLSARLCTVWYDEYSLKLGDNLRESIEKGIKEAKKCVLILTHNYLTNPGWGKKEFNSIFSREIIKNENVILPIWYDVTKEEVYDYSPSLVDTFALMWPKREELEEIQYRQAIELIISKIHMAVKS